MAYRLPILRPVKEIEDRIPPDSFGINSTQFDEMPGMQETPWSGDVGFGAMPEPPQGQAPQLGMAPGYTGPAYTPGPGIGASQPYNNTLSFQPSFEPEPSGWVPPPAPAAPDYGDYEWSQYDAGIPAGYEPPPLDYGVSQYPSDIAPEISATRPMELDRVEDPSAEMIAATGEALLRSLTTDVWENSGYSKLGETGFDFGKAAEIANREAEPITDSSLLGAALSYPGLAALGVAGTAKGTLRLTGKALEQTLAKAGGEAASKAVRLNEQLGEAGALRLPGRPARPVTPLTATQEAEFGKLNAALTADDRTAWQTVVDAKDKIVRATLDKNAPLAKLDKQTGSEVHDLAQVVPGSRAYGENIIRTEFEPVIAPLGKDIENLEKYMVLRRDEDLLTRNPGASLQGGISGWNGVISAKEALARTIGPQRMARIEAVAEQLWGAPGRPQDGLFYKNILKPLQDEGIITPEMVRDMLSANPHYISFRRQMGDDGMEILPGMNQPANVSSTGLKKLRVEGSERKLDNPLAGTLAQVISVRERVARNRAGRALFEALEGLGEATVKTTPGPAPLGSGTMAFFKNGEKIVAEVPEVYAAVAKGLEAETAGMVGKFLTKMASPLRAGATTYNPAFVIINPIRDFISASFQTGWRTMVSPEYLQAWVAAFTKNKAFQDAAKDGALMGGIIDSFADTKGLAKISGRRLLGVQMDSVGDAVAYVPRLIKEINTASERATRIGVYLKGKNEGMAGLQAAVRARNSTVDFAKSGTAIKVINQAIPFLNAGIQGASNTLKVMKTSPQKAIARSVPLAMVTGLAYLNNQRFESASLVPEYEYRNNWVFIVAEEKSNADPKTGETATYPVYIKIPKGPSGALLTLPAEFGIRFAQQKGDYSLQKDMIETILGMGETLSPVSISPSSAMLPGLETGVEVLANKNLYTGREIVPFKEQRKPSEQQFGPETSRQAVAIGQKLGISPRLIDHAVKDYLAGTGQAANWMIDLAIGSLGYNPQVPGAALEKERTETETLSRTPVVSRFLGVKGTEQERQEYEALRLATAETQRRFAKEYPSSVRLGLTIGEGSDSVTQDGKTLYFTPKEQAEIQKKAYEIAKPWLDAVTNETGFKTKYSIEDQRKRMQKVMTEARERARNQVLVDMGKPERTKRLKLSASAPLKLAAGGR